MNKTELRQLKYRVIKNTFHDTQLAYRAREWSEERIRFELGIELPKSTPKLKKDVTEATKKKKQTELFKFRQIRDKLISYDVDVNKAIELARNNKKKSFNLIDRLIRSFEPHDIIDNVDPEVNPLVNYYDWSRADKVKQWADWNRKDNDYPIEIQELAQRINLEKNLDKDHSLGWFVVYQALLNNQDPDFIKLHVEADDYLPDYYKVVGKI